MVAGISSPTSSPVNLQNTQALLQASGMFNKNVGQFNPDKNKTSEASWRKAAVSEGITPQTTQPVAPSTEVTKTAAPSKLIAPVGDDMTAFAAYAQQIAAKKNQTGVNQPIDYLYDDGANPGKTFYMNA